MFRNSANAILPASPWLKSNSNSDSNPATARTKSHTQHALVTIWKTVGGSFAKQSNNRESVTPLDLETPIPEAVLREYEKIDSPTVHERHSTSELPIISPRYSPRAHSGCDPIMPPGDRAIYTPPARDDSADSRPRTPSPARPNYTEASCRASNQNYIESVVREARGLCMEALDTEEADDYVELHASVLHSQETATTLRLARTHLSQNWGAVFYESQLEVIGWRSKLYFVIDKVTPCSRDGGPSPAKIGGLQVGDVVVGVNDKTMESNVQFVNEIKKRLTITLDVVRPNQVEEITDEMFEDQQDEVMKEVLEKARQNAIDSLTRMKGMNTVQKRVFLDAVV